MALKPNIKLNTKRRFFRRQIRKIKFLIKHPSFYVPIISIVSLLIASFTLYHIFQNSSAIKVTPNSKIVIISYDNIKRVIPTKQKTIHALLDKLNIKLRPGDVVEPSLNTPINQDDFRINIYRAKPVAIDYQGPLDCVMSPAKTPRAVVDQANIKIYAQDKVYQKASLNFIKTGVIGSEIVIDQATPISLSLYGKIIPIRTLATTVGQFVKLEHINLKKGAQLIPSSATPISAGMAVLVVEKGMKMSIQNQTIPMPIQTIYDSNLAYGTSAIRQTGSAGQEVITYQDNLINGEVVSQTQSQVIVTVPPVPEIVVEGTSLSGIKGDMALAGIPARDYQYADFIISHESGWCPTKAQGEHYCPAIPDNPYTPYGYGLCQATPGYKMSSMGSDWATNPITQLEWCNGYADSRYGGWYNAYYHWVHYRWW